MSTFLAGQWFVSHTLLFREFMMAGWDPVGLGGFHDGGSHIVLGHAWTRPNLYTNHSRTVAIKSLPVGGANDSLVGD